MGVRLSLLMLCTALSACATTPAKTPDTAVAVKTDRLSPRKLSPGECGMFVWTVNETKNFRLFAEYTKGRAIWFNGEAEDYLATKSVAGPPASGQYPYQVFSAPDDTTLTLDLKQPQAITGGVRYKAGTLTISSGEDWDKIIPVVGLAACQPG